MVLEACMLCLDNSAYARDADISPSRLVAQEETAGIVAGAKTSMHHENAVGVLTYGGERVTMHLSPTSDMGAVLSALHGLRCGGDTDFTRGIQVAQLALKHRMNKNQKQRIIIFVGSPLRCSEKQLTVLGKQLKKNNVAVDVISFGEVEVNAAKLKAFHEAVDSNGTSCLLECSPQPGQLLSDSVLQSRLLHDTDAPGGDTGLRVLPGAAAGGASGMEFGVDINADPELYMALQLSLQEDQQRTRQGGGDAVASSDSISGSGSAAATSTTSSALHSGEAARGGVVAGGTAADIPTAEQIEMMEGIDDELRQALLLSLQDFSGGQPMHEEGAVVNDEGSNDRASAAKEASEAANAVTAGDSGSAAGHVAAEVTMTVADGGSAERRPAGSAGDNATAAEVSRADVFEGGSLAEVLQSLPGVNVNDPRVQQALREANAAEEERSANGQQQPASSTQSKADEPSDKQKSKDGGQ